MTKLTILNEGNWAQIEQAIKTARDYQATSIVLVGSAGMEQIAEDIVENWITFEIPFELAEEAAQISERMLRPGKISVFEGELNAAVKQLTFEDGLVENPDIDLVKTVRLG